MAPNTEDASYQLEVISNDDSSKDEVNQDEEQEAELIPEVKELIELWKATQMLNFFLANVIRRGME